jgi:hypothetical protein
MAAPEGALGDAGCFRRNGRNRVGVQAHGDLLSRARARARSARGASPFAAGKSNASLAVPVLPGQKTSPLLVTIRQQYPDGRRYHEIVVALIRLAGIQTVWSGFLNLTYVTEYKAHYLIEVSRLPTSAEISLLNVKMVLFRCALSVLFGMTLLIFALPLAQRLMTIEESASVDAGSRAGRTGSSLEAREGE